MTRRFLATVEISRPHNMVAAAACVLSGYYLAGGRSLPAIALSVILTSVVTGLGNMINDYYDVDIDSVNKPRRPIPSGRLERSYVARAYLWGSLAASVVIALTLPLTIVPILFAWQVLLFAYARRAKRLPLLGNVLVAGIASSAFFAGAFLGGNVGVAVFPGCLAFFFVMGRELVKGAEDIDGDRRAGAATLAVRYGVGRTVRLAVLILAMCVVSLPVPALAGYYGQEYGLIMELVVAPGILAACYLALRSQEKAGYNRASWILKVEMFLGIVAIALGPS